MPKKVTIDGLIINDSNPPRGYIGPKVFADFNSSCTSRSFKWKYPYVITEEVEIKNLATTSGLPYRISSNQYMFRNVILIPPVHPKKQKKKGHVRNNFVLWQS